MSRRRWLAVSPLDAGWWRRWPAFRTVRAAGSGTGSIVRRVWLAQILKMGPFSGGGTSYSFEAHYCDGGLAFNAGRAGFAPILSQTKRRASD